MDKGYTAEPRKLTQTDVLPIESRRLENGTLLVDFGKAAFGTLLVSLPETPERTSITVHLGEKLTADGRIDREPPGTIRYRRIQQSIDCTESVCRITISPDERNTGPGAIKMPEEIGEVLPFRYAEIEDATDLDASAVRQVFVHYPFDDQASSFKSSDPILNAVWELCKYSIKATTFCGVYVDGDRERIPYEGDAYINQLGHYSVDREYAMARYTHEYLLRYPTWPTEWQLHSVMMAWADYMYTDETQSLEMFYDDLRAKTLIGLARDDGLISTESELCTRELEEQLHLYHPRYIFGHGLRDLVDWPPGSFTEGGQGERDNHEMLPTNTVVNAFHCHALALMSQIASVLGRTDDQQYFAAQAARTGKTINSLLFDSQQGAYIDGEGSSHASLHSNMFMLAFDLVPGEHRDRVTAFVKSRGMACSVYGAQFLLEALYMNNEEEYALDLITAKDDRSWWNMLQAGSTITLEAWDWKYKNNLDWNHAWGAAPANIIPRYLMGIRPLEPGFRKILIQPRPGRLQDAEITFPTIQGAVVVRFENNPEESFTLEVGIPDNTTARIDLPLSGRYDAHVTVDGKISDIDVSGRFATIENLGPGRHVVGLNRHGK